MKDGQQSKELFFTVGAVTATVVVGIFCPPAGMALGVTLAGSEVISAANGKDLISGRELGTGERWTRSVLGVVGLGLGAAELRAFSKSVSMVKGTQSGTLENLTQMMKNSSRSSYKELQRTARNMSAVEKASGANVPNETGGVVQSRINVANGPTRFSSSENAGFNHVLDRHFNPNRNAGQFTISQDQLKNILSSKNTVNISVKEIPGNQFERIVDIGATAGTIKPSIPDVGGTPTNYIRVITDKAGNLITTYPIPKP